MRIIQLVHTLNPGDAISGEAISLQRIFQARGIEAPIWCLAVHEKVNTLGTRRTRYDLESAVLTQSDVLIMHYSLASPLSDLYRRATDCRRLMIYHNLTPVLWFQGYNARVVRDLSQGLQDLAELASASDIVLADSEFNRQELHALGCQHAEVLPLVLDQEKWNLAANEGIRGAFNGHNGGRASTSGQAASSATRAVNLLHVGRLAPNKRIEDIIKTFYFFHQKVHPRSKLWLVGTDIDTEIYSFELRLLVQSLKLEHAVEFVGSVSDCELKAMYEETDLYLCMSEHEGFCVPLLEAMYFSVPVIAFESSAITETLGDGGILVKEKNFPLIAEACQLVLSDSRLRSALIQAGQKRLQTYSWSTFEQNVERTILQKFEANSDPRPQTGAPVIETATAAG